MMAVLQTDSTKVVKHSPRFTADPFAALSERAGFLVVHPKAVGNSQANGIPENFNTWLDKESRELATYQGKGMDSLTLKRVKKITEKMVKAAKAGDLATRDKLKNAAERTGKGLVFSSYAEAEAWIVAVCEKWNDKVHRSLPKIADPVTGKRRHMTPREALQAHVMNGWKPVALGEEHLVDLFRPHVRCKVFREAVSPVGNGQRYRFSGLGAWNGEEVLVAIDPMDWQKVWIKDLNGVLLGVADLVQATGYHAKTLYEIAEEKRARAQLKILGNKAEHVTARTAVTHPGFSDGMILAGQVLTQNEALASAAPPDAEITARPMPSRSARPAAENYAEWQVIDRQLTDGQPVSESDAFWHRSYQNSSQYKALRKVAA
jgi:putative transposase